MSNVTSREVGTKSHKQFRNQTMYAAVGQLAHRSITSVPDDAEALFKLSTSLNLSANALTVLPDWIASLTQLEFFSLASNGLTALPSNLGLLPNLRELDIRSNKLVALPEQIAWSLLQDLDMSGNLLTQLPDMSQLGSLTELNLQRNLLTSLPPSVGALKSLARLCAQQNKVLSDSCLFYGAFNA